MKATIKIDPKLKNFGIDLHKSIVEANAGIINEEFSKLLFNTPQFTGNYVANWRLQVGSSAGSRGGVPVFPTDISRKDAFARGELPAITHAKGENKNLRANVTKYLKTQRLMDVVTVYNRTSYAQTVEDYSAGELRAVNAGGEHALARMENSLSSRFAQTLVVGSSEFKRLRRVNL